MLTTIGDRLFNLINDLGITQKKFATSIKADATHINKILKGKNNPSDSLMYLICEKYNVNFDWLKQGIGNMYIDKSSPQYTEALSIFNTLDKDLQEFAISQLYLLLKLQRNICSKDVKSVQFPLQRELKTVGRDGKIKTTTLTEQEAIENQKFFEENYHELAEPPKKPKKF